MEEGNEDSARSSASDSSSDEAPRRTTRSLASGRTPSASQKQDSSQPQSPPRAAASSSGGRTPAGVSQAVPLRATPASQGRPMQRLTSPDALGAPQRTSLARRGSPAVSEQSEPRTMTGRAQNSSRGLRGATPQKDPAATGKQQQLLGGNRRSGSMPPETNNSKSSMGLIQSTRKPSAPASNADSDGGSARRLPRDTNSGRFRAGSALGKHLGESSDSEGSSMRGSKRKRKEKKRKSAKRSADYTRRSADYTREYGGSDDDLEVNQEFKDLMMEASKSFVQLGSDLKDFHTQYKDVQLEMLDKEEELYESEAHPDYINRMNMIETKHERKSSALETRLGFESSRVESMSRMEREATLRWFMEKKHFVRKDVKADIVGQMDILRLELKALKQQESVLKADIRTSTWDRQDDSQSDDDEDGSIVLVDSDGEEYQFTLSKKTRVLTEGVRSLDELDINTDLGLLRMMTAKNRHGKPVEPRGQFALAEPSAFKMLTEFEKATGTTSIVRADVVEDVDPRIAAGLVEGMVADMEKKELEQVRRLFDGELDGTFFGLLDAAASAAAEDPDGYDSDNRSLTPEPVDGLNLSAWRNDDAMMVDAPNDPVVEGQTETAKEPPSTNAARTNGSVLDKKKGNAIRTGSVGSSTLVTPKVSPRRGKAAS